MLKNILSLFSFKKKKKLPETFEDAVEYVKKNFVIDNSYFTGMDIRNELGLWTPNSVLVKHMVERFGIFHPDDIYLLIKEAILNLSFNLQDSVQLLKDRYKKNIRKGAPITKPPTTFKSWEV